MVQVCSIFTIIYLYLFSKFIVFSTKYDFFLVHRTPVIPGFNDSEDDIHKICEFVSKNCKYYKGIELLAYHKLGRGKYYSLDREYPLNDIMIPTKEKMDMLSQILTDHKIPIYQF